MNALLTLLLGDYNRTGIGRAVSATGRWFWVSDFVKV